MTLSIIVENRLHKPIADPISDASGAIERMCSESGPENPLYGVDPASDTMFNEYQINAILDYLDASDAIAESNSEAVQALQQVAQIAARRGGYLWFRNDRPSEHDAVD
ncbi:hypothetical protein ABZV91_14835 [Nocardia sp. NPDC004568]|uniref:hypothetical protein n=1 Tax=Nocardia sp. NPDC004568 TaxID=3154551 RepID=UPI0033AFDB93